MESETTTALLAGGFALAGGLGGVMLSGWLSRGADRQRIEAEDERRWLTDRRTAYAEFLGLAESMLRDIDGFAVFLPGHGEDVDREDDEHRRERLYEYFHRWEEEVQPALGEVELLATPRVADLAERVSAALMDISSPVELRRSFQDYYPGWFQARDLVEVLRTEMRTELGLPVQPVDERIRSRREDDYPWLPDRPPRESYIQDHSRREPQ